MKNLIALTLLSLLAFGCTSSSNVNVDRADGGAGYVDFYTDTDMGLAWDVQEAPSGADDFETVFSDVKPITGNVLRLPLAPGQHQLRVTFQNRVVSKPADVNVIVESGKVTPVRIGVAEAGPTIVVTKRTIAGGTNTRSGRQTDIQRNESTIYELSANTGASIALEPEWQMSYSH